MSNELEDAQPSPKPRRKPLPIYLDSHIRLCLERDAASKGLKLSPFLNMLLTERYGVAPGVETEIPAAHRDFAPLPKPRPAQEHTIHVGQGIPETEPSPGPSQGETLMKGDAFIKMDDEVRRIKDAVKSERPEITYKEAASMISNDFIQKMIKEFGSQPVIQARKQVQVTAKNEAIEENKYKYPTISALEYDLEKGKIPPEGQKVTVQGLSHTKKGSTQVANLIKKWRKNSAQPKENRDADGVADVKGSEKKAPTAPKAKKKTGPARKSSSGQGVAVANFVKEHGRLPTKEEMKDLTS